MNTNHAILDAVDITLKLSMAVQAAQVRSNMNEGAAEGFDLEFLPRLCEMMNNIIDDLVYVEWTGKGQGQVRRILRSMSFTDWGSCSRENAIRIVMTKLERISKLREIAQRIKHDRAIDCQVLMHYVEEKQHETINFIFQHFGA